MTGTCLRIACSQGHLLHCLCCVLFPSSYAIFHFTVPTTRITDKTSIYQVPCINRIPSGCYLILPYSIINCGPVLLKECFLLLVFSNTISSMHCSPFFPAICCILFLCRTCSVNYKLVSIIGFIAPMNFYALNTIYKVAGSILDIGELHTLIILGMFQGQLEFCFGMKERQIHCVIYVLHTRTVISHSFSICIQADTFWQGTVTHLFCSTVCPSYCSRY